MAPQSLPPTSELAIQLALPVFPVAGDTQAAQRKAVVAELSKAASRDGEEGRGMKPLALSRSIFEAVQASTLSKTHVSSCGFHVA